MERWVASLAKLRAIEVIWLGGSYPLPGQSALDPSAIAAAQADVPMLLDTGADVSLVPLQVVQQIGVIPLPGQQYQLIAFDGTISSAPVVQLELVFCRRTFRGQFLLIDQANGILGRNVLNGVPLLLDGPRLLWDEYRAHMPCPGFALFASSDPSRSPRLATKHPYDQPPGAPAMPCESRTRRPSR